MWKADGMVQVLYRAANHVEVDHLGGDANVLGGAAHDHSNRHERDDGSYPTGTTKRVRSEGAKAQLGDADSDRQLTVYESRTWYACNACLGSRRLSHEYPPGISR